MRCFYEYKEKDGVKVGGHNLERIHIIDNFIKLSVVDYISTIYDIEKRYWTIILDMRKLDYLNIKPMNVLDEEGDLL